MVEKKKFFPVELPLISQSVDLLAFSQSSLNGKTVKIDLTRKLRGKSVEATFKIELKNDKLEAKLRRLSLLGYFIRRIIREGTDYVEDSFPVTCKNCKLRIKPFLITRKKVSRAVKNALRKETKVQIMEYAKEKNCEEIFSDVLSNKLQKTMIPMLKKIYPLALCEIREIYIEA